MGGMLSKHFRREQRQSKEEEAEADAVSSNENGKSSTQGSISIIELMKPECLKTKKMRKNKKRSRQSNLNSPGKKITKARKLTLEEWLLASPGPNNSFKPAECFSGGELHVFKHFSKRIHPSSSSSTGVDIHHEAAAAAAASGSRSDSISIDVSANSCSMSRSQSGKLKKKVSFRMPEEADIIIFHSPEEALETDYESS